MTDGTTTDWDALWKLRRCREVSAAAVCVYWYLWVLAERKPGQLVISRRAIAEELGMTTDAINAPLRRLQALDLLHVRDWGRRRPWRLWVDLYHPNPGRGQEPPGPKQLLLWEVSEQNQSQSQSQRQSDPEIERPPSTTPVETSGETAGQNLRRDRPSKPEVPQVVSAARDPPRVSDRHAVCSMVPMKKRVLTYQGTNEQSDPKSNAIEVTPAEGCGPQPIGNAICETLIEFMRHTDPVEQKARLRQQIRRIVADPQMGAYIDGALADMVLHAEVPHAELDALLRDVMAMRETGKLRSPGAFVNRKAQELAERYGFKWPARKISGMTKTIEVPKTRRELTDEHNRIRVGHA